MNRPTVYVPPAELERAPQPLVAVVILALQPAEVRQPMLVVDVCPENEGTFRMMQSTIKRSARVSGWLAGLVNVRPMTYSHVDTSMCRDHPFVLSLRCVQERHLIRGVLKAIRRKYPSAVTTDRDGEQHGR